MRIYITRKKRLLSFELILKSLAFLFVIILFLQSFIRGSKGFIYYTSLQKDIAIESKKIDKLKQKIVDLKREVDVWNTDDFMVEKVARQDLQMAFPDEKIYLVK